MDYTVRDKIIQEAISWKGVPYLYGGDSKTGIDCSHFVWRVYKAVVFPDMPYIFNDPSRDGEYFNQVAKEKVLKGDLVVWSGHIGIVVDPILGTFIGSQSTNGVSGAYYSSGYWSNHSYFLQSKW